MRITTFIALVAAVGLAAMQAAGAQSAGLHVLASNGMRAVVDELEPQLERAAGRPLTIEFGTTAGMRARIEGGEPFDVTVVTTEAMDALVKAGKIVPDSVGALGRSGVGIGVRAGAPKPDIGSADALKKTLLAAKSFTWVGVGAARPIIERMLATLGIAADAQPKIVLAQSVDETIELVASGKVEMVLTLASEILPAHGVQYVGPFPADVQGYVAFAAGVGAKAALPAEGVKLVAALRAPDTASTYQAKGMELAAR